MAPDTIERLDDLTSLFHLLSDKTRLHILLLLSRGERNVTSLCDELQLPQPTVSHHLGLLRMNGLVANRRAGKQIFYGLNGLSEPSPAKTLAFNLNGVSVHIAAKGGDPGAAGEPPDESPER